MIVQSAPPGEPSFVIIMKEHLALAGSLARIFGNADFEPSKPRQHMLFVAENHDRGWDDVDPSLPSDPETGLPFSLERTPFNLIVKTMTASPDFNERHHAYCGLISSMHTCGLLNGRYGLTDFVWLDVLEGDPRVQAQNVFDGENARQQRLKAELGANPATAAWVEETHLFQNYRQLQFFDTLALYFNRVQDAARGEATFIHVPMNECQEPTVAIRPMGHGPYGR